MWRFIHNKMLWGRVLSSKCFPGLLKVEWLIFLRKLVVNNYIGCKAMIEDFPLIGEGLV